MDVLRNSLAARPVDESLVTEHPFSTTVSREGREEKLSRAEPALEFIFSPTKHGPGSKA